MIYFIYNYRDKYLSCFDAPILTTEDSEHFVPNVKRTLAKIKPLEFQIVKDKALYFFGTFDDEAGKFNILQEPQKLFDVEDIIGSFDSVVARYKNNKVRDDDNDAVVNRYEFNIALEQKKLQMKEGVENA